ncbi:hypothetical protein EIP91_000150 [Steccherinum ochraceum]|uniref:Uncharacterized protein n=1 Tax=Steccherinum ochraceum TaxID=92696 RepID=A0A4R0S1E0_9APHY|nr:hypothetical protein EIP91_000150 [Steccherinum ochraceum]
MGAHKFKAPWAYPKSPLSRPGPPMGTVVNPFKNGFPGVTPERKKLREELYTAIPGLVDHVAKPKPKPKPRLSTPTASRPLPPPLSRAVDVHPVFDDDVFSDLPLPSNLLSSDPPEPHSESPPGALAPRCSKKRCRKLLPPAYRYKMCAKCREYGRNSSKRAAERKRAELEHLYNARSSSPGGDVAMMDVDREDESLPVEERLKKWISKLRVAGRLPLASSDNGKEDYEEGEDGSGKRKVSGSSSASTDNSKKRRVDENGEQEYQSQADLSRALSDYMRRIQSVTSVGDFLGSYMVAVDEHKEVTEAGAIRVAKEIVQSGNIFASLCDPPAKKRWRSNGQPSVQVDLWCECSDGNFKENNLCDGAIAVFVRPKTVEHPQFGLVHGHKVTVKVVHDP